jgi:hypothetical protein
LGIEATDCGGPALQLFDRFALSLKVVARDKLSGHKGCCLVSGRASEIELNDYLVRLVFGEPQFRRKPEDVIQGGSLTASLDLRDRSLRCPKAPRKLPAGQSVA